MRQGNKKRQPPIFIASAITLLTMILISFSCGGEPRLSIMVCGDLLVPENIDSIRLVTKDAVGKQSLAGYMDLLDPDRELDDPCPKIVHELPIYFVLAEGLGEMTVIAEGLLDGVVKITSHAKAEFPARGSLPISLLLSESCMGISCATGQTCISGKCDLMPRGENTVCPEPLPKRSDSERCPDLEPPMDEEEDEDNS